MTGMQSLNFRSASHMIWPRSWGIQQTWGPSEFLPKLTPFKNLPAGLDDGRIHETLDGEFGLVKLGR